MIPDDSPLILVCDDDSMQRLLIRQCLESEGMRIFEAKDGYEALELIANNAPDFVFMDVDMPGIEEVTAPPTPIPFIGPSCGLIELPKPAIPITLPPPPCWPC